MQVTVPVVGGHAGVTILPLLSQVRAYGRVLGLLGIINVDKSIV